MKARSIAQLVGHPVVRARVRVGPVLDALDSWLTGLRLVG